MPTINPIGNVLDELHRGRMVILTDRDDREGEADLFAPAVHATPKIVNFMIREGRGLVCVPMTAARAGQLHLPLMVPPVENHEAHRCQFTVSVDAANGITTGISAADRATTIRRLADADADDFVRPGHVFPLVAAGDGLAERDGHTEAAIALCELAGLPSVGVICEIIKADGTMARGQAVGTFARRHHLSLIGIAEVPRRPPAIAAAASPAAFRLASAALPTKFGTFAIHVFTAADGREHVALSTGDVRTDEPVLVRLHSQCLTGDTFHSLKCDCQGQLHAALQQIAAAGRGVLLYLSQEGRGIGLANKIRAYALQDHGLDPVEANLALGFPPDVRDYGVAAEMLRTLGVRRITLLTNNPGKIAQLEQGGIAVVRRVPLVAAVNGLNRRYLRAKVAKLGHQLPLPD